MEAAVHALVEAEPCFQPTGPPPSFYLPPAHIPGLSLPLLKYNTFSGLQWHKLKPGD